MVTTQFLSGFFYGVMEKKLRSMETSEGGLRQAQPPGFTKNSFWGVASPAPPKGGEKDECNNLIY